MASAVTAVLDREIFPGPTARDAFGNSHELSEVSNRTGSPLLRLQAVPMADRISDSRRRQKSTN